MILSIIVLVLGTLLIAFIVVALTPFRRVKHPEPDPATSYEDAMQRIEKIIEAEKSQKNLTPVCLTRAMTHGERVEKAIVLYHGITSCPAQFSELGKRFHEKGYNVIIPRHPHHGEEDRTNPSLPEMTAEELAEFGMHTVDIAQGLGERVFVSGLSGGGALTIWLAQERDDIDIAMPVSPFLGVKSIPASLNRPLARILAFLPNFWVWWDSETKENNPTIDDFQYPRFTTHTMTSYMRLGYTAERDATKKAPAGKIIMVSNGAEPSVNNDVIDQFVRTWKKHEEPGAETVKSFRFDESLELPHDLISPNRHQANTTVVHPKLIELLES